MRLFGLAALVLLLFVPFEDTRSNIAQIEYSHAWRLFEQGYLTNCQHEAELGYKAFRLADPRWAERFLLLESEAMLYRGLYDQSLNLLNGFRDVSGREGLVRKLTIEAIASTRQQQLQRAEHSLDEAEKNCAAETVEACGEVFSARAILDLKRGQSAEARQQFLNGLSFARSHRDPYLQAQAALNLGYIALQADRYDEAVDWSRLAYRAASTSGYENTMQIAAGNLGWAYYQLGDRERALEQFQQAEKSAERIGNVRYQLKWLSTAGYIYLDGEDFERAEGDYRRALYLARQIDSKEDVENALIDLAQVSVLNGQLGEAQRYIDQAGPMGAGGGNRLSAEIGLIKGMLSVERHENAQAESAFRALQDDPVCPMTIRLDAGWRLAELFEAEGRSTAAEDWYKATLVTYESDRAKLKSEEAKLPFGGNAEGIYDSYVHLLVHEGKAELALMVADQSRARTLDEGLEQRTDHGAADVATQDPRGIAQKLNATLLFYWLGESESYLWAITPGKVAVFTLPARKQIAGHVERYRKTILELRDPLRAGDQDGEWLYRTLVAPASGLIRNGKQVVLLVDGELSELNFETLLVPDVATHSPQNQASGAKVHYLIEDVTLTSAPSLAMAEAAQGSANHGKGLLILGDPVTPSEDYPSLPLFGAEMTRIESHFDKSSVLALGGGQGTPAAYLASNPRQYAYIHFVSHAIASRIDPLDSAIVLSRSTADENSFKLYARDIIQHRIDAKLVTISACYGTGTRSYAGEGLVGLSWAFLRAGAERVIGALWEVSDNSTPRLMDTLYQGLEAGDSPAESLRKAKLALLNAGGRYSLPFYWAPFQMYGRQ